MTLSDKIGYSMRFPEAYIYITDVKEFIEELKLRFGDAKNGGRISISPKEYRDMIDKLAGEKLI